ncbi:PQQ-dependent sugar dehydrogenase [bacterium]|nr:PQQ-dependent sugar dehydrogenase [bacterium]
MRFKNDCSFSIIIFTLMCSGFLSIHAQSKQSGSELYQKACAQCHGTELQGGQAQSLTDAVWQFGSKRSHIFRNIKYGISDFAMPAFEEALSDDDINRVLDFVFASEKASGSERPSTPEKMFTLDYEVKIDVVADNLDIPWAIDFLNEDHALITERPGNVRLFAHGQLHPQPIKGTPAVLHEGQGGLLDVSIDPNYAESGWIYLSYSHALTDANGDRKPAMTRLVRGKIKDHTWVNQEVIYEAPHDLYTTTRQHYGSRIVFDPKGYLYFSIGERGIGIHAQDIRRPNGKVHRIHKDGSIPSDNPFVGREDALPSIFTFGNRNPQGLAIHPETGRVWETEHGPMGGDELNLIQGGGNYGWPSITYGRNYDGGVVSQDRTRQGMMSPSLYWKPSIAVCGIHFVNSPLFPRWKNHLLVGALKYEEVRLLDIQDDRVMHQEIILKNAGRVRDVCSAPDGALYVVTNGPDTLLKMTPVRDMNLEP